MAVTSINPDVEFWNIVNRIKDRRDNRTRQPRVALHDGNWVLRGRANHLYSASFSEIENETGTGKIEMPPEHYLSKWINDHENRPTKNVHVSVEKDGVRWTGRMWHWEMEQSDDGKVVCRVFFRHDYEEFKHIICWSNPFLPAEVQFPKIWLLFGTAKWCLKTTLFCNILRLETYLWSIPDNPLDLDNWGSLLTSMANWSMVVAPDQGEEDNSPLAIVHSRFKYFHDVQKDIAEDAQLTPVFRRFFEGDDPPWPGANLRHGCLVIDYQDKSDWLTGTSFGGSIFTGLIHAAVNIASDGYTEGIDILADPIFPPEYYEPGWMGTLAKVPSIIYRHGERSGIKTSLFTGSPAKDARHVMGGHSAPGVNELISAAVQTIGDMIAAALFIPPVGGAVDAILKPLYTDVFLAFMHWSAPGRATSLGFSHYKERLAEGGDRAYTLSGLIALRTSIWSTRETFTHKLEVQDGMPWLIGQRGRGHFYLGDRIGSTVKGGPLGKIYVDRVSEIELSWDRKNAPTWKITIGERKIKDPVIKALEKIQELFGIVRDLGLV